MINSIKTEINTKGTILTNCACHSHCHNHCHSHSDCPSRSHSHIVTVSVIIIVTAIVTVTVTPTLFDRIFLPYPLALTLYSHIQCHSSFLVNLMNQKCTLFSKEDFCPIHYLLHYHRTLYLGECKVHCEMTLQMYKSILRKFNSV